MKEELKLHGKRVKFLIKGFAAIFILDFFLFLFPGGGHGDFLLRAIFWPIYTPIIYNYAGKDFVEYILILLIHIMGISAYSIYPNILTKLISIIALILWCIAGIGVGFMGA